MHLAWFDLVFVGLLVLSGVFAASRGFVQEALSLFAWGGAAIATLILFPAFQPVIRQNIQPDLAADAAGILGVFFVALIPLSYVGYQLSGMARGSKIDPLDRAAGFVFGAVRGLFVIALAYIGFSALVKAEDYPAWLTEASSYPLVRQSGEVVLAAAAAARGDTGVRPSGAEGTRDGDGKPDDAAEGTTYGPADREKLDDLTAPEDSGPRERQGRTR